MKNEEPKADQPQRLLFIEKYFFEDNLFNFDVTFKNVIIIVCNNITTNQVFHL